MSDNHQFAQAVEITTAAYDRAARDYAARKDTLHSLWRERMDRFVERLDANERDRPIPPLGRPGDDIALDDYLMFFPVLDAGCGPGRDARALAAHDLPILGVDISQGMLDEAGERTARRLSRGAIRYALMDLRRLDLPDASCRGVWCSASLLHLPRANAPRAVAELARVTRPGGPIAIFVKVRGAGVAEGFEPYPIPGITDLPRFFTYYTPEEARALVEGAGLDVLDLTVAEDGRPNAPDWIALLARKP